MNDSDKDLTSKQKEFEEFLKKASNAEKFSLKANSVVVKEVIHPNSLITKNISLFTKNPNYKLLTWLIIQLLIFSLFLFAVTIFKNNLIPYLNGI
tara:strand:+ start:155 stop:439 length:285 start_codon:yes stop_codon:yes gene_type:complete